MYAQTSQFHLLCHSRDKFYQAPRFFACNVEKLGGVWVRMRLNGLCVSMLWKVVIHFLRPTCVKFEGIFIVCCRNSPGDISSWIYMPFSVLGVSTDEKFFSPLTERIYWACEVASKQRKMLMSRPKMKPVS